MATGFKTATVNAARVAATLAGYPTYVDLSRLGITTLAEAQSVRVYAESSKTTEWAREIVSATEMHVKIPSLTTTTEIYVDYDGVRADYAVGATYGRNAVWSEYNAVYHMQDASGSLTDASGNADLSVAGAPTFGAAGKIEDAVDYSGSGQYHTSTLGGTTTEALTLQAWAKPDVVTPYSVVFTGQGNAEHGITIISSKAWALSEDGTNAQAAGATTLSTGVFYLLHAVFVNDASRIIYVNGASDGTNTTSKALASATGIKIGDRFTTTSQRFNGTVDEVRLRSDQLSANWITTEYNNQNNEATFWGTWTDAGGGPTANNSARRMLLMQM